MPGVKKNYYSIEAVIAALQATHGMTSLAAQKLGCSYSTVKNYINRYPKVKEAMQAERDRMTDIAETSLFNQIIKGEGWAVCFYLKTQGKDRGYVERQEHTGANGGPMQIAQIREIIVELPKLPDDE